MSISKFTVIAYSGYHNLALVNLKECTCSMWSTNRTDSVLKLGEAVEELAGLADCFIYAVPSVFFEGC